MVSRQDSKDRDAIIARIRREILTGKNFVADSYNKDECLTFRAVVGMSPAEYRLLIHPQERKDSMPPKQLSLVEDDKADPQIAKDADRYVEAVKEVKDATERKKKFAGLIVRALKKMNRSRVRHGDMIIEISEKAAAETIKIKKAKQSKVTKSAVQPKAPEKK